MADTTADDEPTNNLPSKFAKLLSYYSQISNFSGPQTSEKLVNLISAACATCESAIDLVNHLNIFSKNESLDDISTHSIRYLMLPALLGYFRTQNNQDRQNNLHLAITLYKHFLNVCSENFIPFPCGTVDERHSISGSTVKTMDQMISNREAKIKRYKMKKSLEDRLEQLAEYVDQPHVDEEVKREYNIKLVQKWICIAQDELPNLKLEFDLLSHRANSNNDDNDPIEQQQQQHTTKSFKPFILTRSAVQSAVFGAGYPSLPTMTLDEFYEQQVAAGILPPPSTKPVNQSNSTSGTVRRIDVSNEEKEAAEQRKARNDDLADRDDVEYLHKARDFDNFKDEHRRGSGNRMNRA